MKRSRVVYILYFILAILGPYQIWLIHFGESYLPITAVLAVSVGALGFAGGMKSVLGKWFYAYLVWNLLSLAWCSDFGPWMYQQVFGNMILLCYFAALSLKLPDVTRLIRICLWSAVPNTILVCTFRMNTLLESLFLDQYLAFFKNPERINRFSAFNVYDSLKAGGVFDNANTAASFHLTCLGGSVALWWKLSPVERLLLCAFNFAGIMGTGSKSAVIVLSLASLLLFVRICVSKFRRLPVAVLGIALLVGSGFIFSGTDIGSVTFDSDFARASETTSEDRMRLLEVASFLFWKSPFLGLGYGGWFHQLENLTMRFGVRADWPPHNSIVQAWADSGLPNMIIVLAIISLLLGKLLDPMLRRDFQVSDWGLVVAVVCPIVMAFGDPEPFLGPPQAAPILGLLLASVFRTNLRCYDRPPRLGQYRQPRSCCVEPIRFLTSVYLCRPYIHPQSAQIRADYELQS